MTLAKVLIVPCGEIRSIASKSIFLGLDSISSVMPMASKLGRRKLAETPEIAAVYTISFAPESMIIFL